MPYSTSPSSSCTCSSSELFYVPLQPCTCCLHGNIGADNRVIIFSGSNVSDRMTEWREVQQGGKMKKPQTPSFPPSEGLILWPQYSKEKYQILWKPWVHFFVHKSLSLHSILSQSKPVPIVTSCTSKIRLNIVLSLGA